MSIDHDARQAAARRAMGGHGLGSNAENYARMPDDRRMPEGAALVYVVLWGCVCIGALAGWLARGWWG